MKICTTRKQKLNSGDTLILMYVLTTMGAIQQPFVQNFQQWFVVVNIIGLGAVVLLLCLGRQD